MGALTLATLPCARMAAGRGSLSGPARLGEFGQVGLSHVTSLMPRWSSTRKVKVRCSPSRVRDARYVRGSAVSIEQRCQVVDIITHSSLRQRKCQHRLASRLCAAPQILFSRLRADEPQYQGLDERLFACCDPKLPAGLREMHFNCRQGDAHAFRYARVPQPFGQPLQAFLFPW